MEKTKRQGAARIQSTGDALGLKRHPTRGSNVWKGLLAGLIGGAVGSWTMELFQTAWSKAAARLDQQENQKADQSKESHPHNGEEQTPATLKAASAISQ